MGDLWTSTKPKARVAHACDQCRQTIRPGETYHYSKGLWDGHFATTKTCLPCADLMGDMFKAGWYSDGPDGEECLPWLPEVDYWQDVRFAGPEWVAKVDAYHNRAEAARKAGA